jgi:hypothetical protein
MADSARRPRLRPPTCRGASRACKRVDAFGAPAGNAERSRVRNAALSFPSRRAAGSGSATRSRPIPSRRCPALGRAFRSFRTFPEVSGRFRTYSTWRGGAPLAAPRRRRDSAHSPAPRARRPICGPYAGVRLHTWRAPVDAAQRRMPTRTCAAARAGHGRCEHAPRLRAGHAEARRRR